MTVVMFIEYFGFFLFRFFYTAADAHPIFLTFSVLITTKRRQNKNMNINGKLTYGRIHIGTKELSAQQLLMITWLKLLLPHFQLNLIEILSNLLQVTQRLWIFFFYFINSTRKAKRIQ